METEEKKLDPVHIIRAKHFADAYIAVARANHYMVGIVAKGSVEELEAAEQILINIQNMGPRKGAAFERLERALDLIEAAIKEAKRAS